MYAYLGHAYAAIDEAAAGNELVATQCRALITGYAHKYYSCLLYTSPSPRD